MLVLDYVVKEKPLLAGDMQGGPDYLVLKNLDTDSIRIIGSVLGQSIALDYFVSQVRSLYNFLNLLRCNIIGQLVEMKALGCLQAL